MYTSPKTIAFSETAPDDCLKLTALLDYYQDVCTFQSDDLGIGTAYLREHGIGWVASSWQILIYRYPRMGERVVVGTWAYDFRGAMGMRNFTMKNEDGEILSAANSIWSMISIESGMLTRVPGEIIDIYETEPKYDMEYAPRKIPVPDDLKPLDPVEVAYRHLDSNGHVNNAQYVAIAEDLIPELRRCHELRVEYRSSARPGNVIHPLLNGNTMVLADDAGAPYVVIAYE